MHNGDPAVSRRASFNVISPAFRRPGKTFGAPGGPGPHGFSPLNRTGRAFGS